MPAEVHVGRDGRVTGKFREGSADPFARDREGLFLAESFARAPLDRPRDARAWMLSHGVVTKDEVPFDPQWHFDLTIEQILVEQERIRWHLRTIRRLSETLNERSRWDPTWSKPLLRAGLALGAFDPDGRPKFASYYDLGLADPERYMAAVVREQLSSPPTELDGSIDEEYLASGLSYTDFTMARLRSYVTDEALRFAASVAQAEASGAEVLPLPDAFAVDVPADAVQLFSGIAPTWEGTLQLEARLVGPYLGRANETYVDVTVTRRGISLLEHRSWSSLELPVYVQLFEALDRVASSKVGGARCRECGKDILVLDARRKFFCTSVESHRRASRLAWRDAHPDAQDRGR